LPELPEVETIRRQLAPALVGRRIVDATVLDPRWSEPAPPEAIADALGGRRVERLWRRGKYLVMSTEDDIHLAMHLRMTGNLLLVPPEEDDPGRPHLRVRFELGRTPERPAERLLFVDVRRFGTGDVLLGSDALSEYFASRLGVEPLSSDFTAAALRAQARGRKQPVKAFLLNQERVAGVGNIYADEALFRARIHPLRRAGSLNREQLEALREAVVGALSAGLDAGGATIDDFRHADGVRGSFQDEFLVHRRRGEPCPRCGTAVVKFVAAGRGTYACERCQPKPRIRRPAAR
jgi:formamidopyrimidine-DNA glycosylase